MTDNNLVSDLVRKLFSAFLSKDWKALEDLLSDDFTFNSPRDDHISKTTYFERCFPKCSKTLKHLVAFQRKLCYTRP